MMYRLIIAAALLSLTGCLTPEKATGYLKKKNLLDDACAAEYPCKTTGFDSTDYKRSLGEIDSLYVAIDSIVNSAPHVLPVMTAEPGNYTPNPEDYIVYTPEQMRIDKLLKAKVAELQNKLKVIKPVIEYRDDSAKIKGYADKISELSAANNNLTYVLKTASDERDKWRTKARQRFWIIIGLSSLHLLWLLLILLKRKL